MAKPKLPKPFVQSNAYAEDNAQLSDLNKKRDWSMLSASEKQLYNEQNPSDKKPFDFTTLLTSALAATAALIPAGQVSNPLTPILDSYNPMPQGRGSSAIAKNGMKIRKYLEGGGPVSPLLQDPTAIPKAAPKKPKKLTVKDFEQLHTTKADDVWQKANQLKASRFNPYNYDEDTIKLSNGKFKNASVPRQLIEDAYTAAKKNGVDPYEMLGLIGQESGFGNGDQAAQERRQTQQQLISGWDLGKDQYEPYRWDRFLADKKVPGVAADKTNRGINYYVADENQANDYINKNPKLMEEYQQKIASAGYPEDFDYFSAAAQKIKQKGIQSYNPGDKNYSTAVKQSAGLLRKDPELAKYLSSRKMEAGGDIHIKKENKGKFTASAKGAGMGVQEFASHVLAKNDDYSSTQVKRANFAKNASKWKHDAGGKVEQLSHNPYDGGTTQF